LDYILKFFQLFKKKEKPQTQMDYVVDLWITAETGEDGSIIFNKEKYDLYFQKYPPNLTVTPSQVQSKKIEC